MRRIASLLSAILVASTLSVPPAVAAPPEPLRPQVDASVPGRDAPPTAVAQGETRSLVRRGVVWPEAKVIAPGVEILDSARAKASGVDGLLLRVDSPEKTADIRIDYSGFRHAHGADWATRLRLVRLSDGLPLASTNDIAAGVVTARVPGDSGLVALAAAAQGPAGDYAATPLQASSTWSGGGNSGAFVWSYPFRVPPSPGGLEPELGLSYSSASVDGRMAASNNQPSWIGEGFEFGSGFVERRYKPCAKDGGNGASAGTNSGDLCWKTDNAFLSVDGYATELILGTDGKWHGRSEDGWRIERKTGAANGDDNGEHWVATAPNGTQYWFGRNRMPGWVAGKTETQSTWTVPVYGNGAGEPCHATGWCDQAWRWNLDYVVDPFGNTMSYWYVKERNKYARNMSGSTLTEYVRGGYLDRIDYGTRSDTSYGTVPMQVDLVPGSRTVDVPRELECTTSSCLIGSPTFWTANRLSQVVTRVWTGSAHRTVETWTLHHTYPDPGDTTRAGLWLDRISHSGGTTTVPDVSFVPTQLPNRVDATDLSPAMNWSRIAHINTESGLSISVTYLPQDCVAKVRIPSAPESNTLRCYPVKWKPNNNANTITDYFHRYVVHAVTETDMALHPDGRSAPKVTTFEYLDTPAWHYTDDDGLIDDADKTWAGWRGYGRVRVTEGQSADRTRTETVYFRGMHGDKLPSGTRSVTLPAAGGAPVVNDEDEFAGMVREQIVYNGPTTTEVEAEVQEPWRSAPTASRTINGITVHARYVDVGATRNRVALDGGRGFRRTTTRTTFDSLGMPTHEEDLGDDALTGDERCVLTTYARNTTAWLVEYPSRTRTFATTCAAAAGTVTAADVIADTYTSYDQGARGAAPTKGAVSMVEELKEWPSSYLVTSRAAHDVHGRPVNRWDARGNLTTTAFTPATGGPVTGILESNHLDWDTTTTVDPAWGSPTVVVDKNGKRTEYAYDGLGRVTGVWLPGRARSGEGSIKYGYTMRRDGPSAVTTSKLNASGGYTIRYDLFDAHLRPRQSQTSDGGSGRVLTDTFYDTAGREVKSNDPYPADGAPSAALFLPLPDAQIPGQTLTTYDGAGRVRITAELVKGTEKWRTTTDYGGDRTDVTPPAGGIRTSTFVDARDRTTIQRQYVGAANRDTVNRYNRKGLLESVTDPAGNRWNYTYDFRGRKTIVDDPDRGRSTLAYDDHDLLSETDQMGRVLTHTYDSLGRKTVTSAGSTKIAEWKYDTVAKGQLSSSSRWVGTAEYVDAITEYDDGYRILARAITVPAGEANVSGTYTYRNTYKVDGSPATTTLPALGGLPAEVLVHGYDSLGRPTTLSTNLSSSGEDTFIVNGTGYTRLGELATISRRYDGGKWMSTGRFFEDGTRRLAKLLTTRENAPTVLAEVQYGYDAAGNVTKVSDLSAGDHQCLAYDAQRQLAEAWTPESGDCGAARSVAALGGPAPYWQSFTYDTAGNRATSTERTPTTTASRTYDYPAAGTAQPHTVRAVTTTGAGAGTVNYTYDGTGNTLTRPGGQTIGWDAEGNMASTVDGAGTISYLYDAGGNRLVRRDPGAKTLYLPGQELRAVGTTKTATRFYSHAGDFVGVRTAAGLTWQADDHQGTTQVSVTASTQAATVRRQTPFGTARGASVSWPTDKGFVGGTVDGTGTVHLGAREYDPAIGRFTSIDPIINHGDPQQMHGYSYANSTPVTMSDPEGLIPPHSIDPVKKKPKGKVQNHKKKPKSSARSSGRVLAKMKAKIKHIVREKKRNEIGNVIKRVPRSSPLLELWKQTRLYAVSKMIRQPEAVIIPDSPPAVIGEGFGLCDPSATQTVDCAKANLEHKWLKDGKLEKNELPAWLVGPFFYEIGEDYLEFQRMWCSKELEKKVSQKMDLKVLDILTDLGKRSPIPFVLTESFVLGWDLTCVVLPPQPAPRWVNPEPRWVNPD